MLVDTLTYAGNDTDDRALTFTGALASVTPDLVIIKVDQGDAGVFSTGLMDTGYSATLEGTLARATGLVKTLASGGFTVGTDARVNSGTGGKDYYAVGFYDDGAGDFETFTYTGDGSDPSNRDILSFQPCFMLTKRDTSGTRCNFKFEEQTGDATFHVNTETAFTNRIQAWRASGFELGSSTSVNQDTSVYHGFAFKAVDGFIEAHTYIADGVDATDVVLDGTAFTPEFVLVKGDNAQALCGRWHVSGDNTFKLDGGNWIASNLIQDLNATGFERGTHDYVDDGSSTYYYIALKNNPASSPESEDQSPGIGFTELVDDWHEGGSYVNGLHTIWREGNDTTVDSSSTSAWPIGGIAVEIKNETTGITASLSGTATPYIGDTDIVTGGKTLTLSLTNDTWAAAGTGPIGSTADTQAIIDGLTSAQSEGAGWNAEVRDKEVTTAVVRTSNTVATITLTASPSYVITADETITATIPAAALAIGVSAVVATPTVAVTYEQFEANDDINWLNPPTLPARTDSLSYNSASNITIEFETIDAESGNALNFTDCTNVTIENCLITNAGNNGIYLVRSSGITIRNCKITDCNGDSYANSGYGVYLYDCADDVSVYGNWIEACAGGVRVDTCHGHDNYSIKRNFFKNMRRVGSQGVDVFFTYSNGMTNAEVTENTSRSVWGENSAQDHINTFISGGTAASPLMITSNKIWGGGSSTSGGGILGVDYGSSGVGYVTVDGNTLVDPGQYGLAISGGHNYVITNNSVFSSKNYEGVGVANVGIYVWRQAGSSPGECHSCTVSNNNCFWWSGITGGEVGSWIPNTGDDSLPPNHGTIAEGNVLPTGWATNDFSYSTWNTNGGNQGYTDLPIPSTWTYYAPE